jgi:hypothetical protein
MLLFTHALKRAIRLNASAILFVSLSAVGADKLDEPKLLKSKAKKRLSTYNGQIEICSIFDNRHRPVGYLQPNFQ